ncbi:MAG: helix-turn-helix transcriptional regulator, partial [Candidatus Poribacteria bacterium]
CRKSAVQQALLIYSSCSSRRATKPDSHNGGRCSTRLVNATSSLILEGSGYRLTVRLIRQSAFRLLFFEEEPEKLPIERLQAHGLTRRECEVMQWLIAGKSNPEVACILNVRVVTIEKHLGSVFQKLNVENRTAAVTTALELIKSTNGIA